MCVTCFELDPFDRLGISEVLPHPGAVDPVPAITVWSGGPVSFVSPEERQELTLLNVVDSGEVTEEAEEEIGSILLGALETLGVMDMEPGATEPVDSIDDTAPPVAMEGATATVIASGIPIIDGVLYSARWNVSTITYSFPDESTDYESGYYRNAPNEDFGQISLTQQALISAALDGETWFSFEGFTLANVEYAGFSNDATIRAAYSSDAGGSAYAYLPTSNYAGGDMWFGPNNGYNYANPVLGSTSWRSTLHEIGHALGLKHGHTAQYGNPALPVEYNHHEYSLMTYYSWEGKGGSGYTNETWGYPQTFMMADIAALQYMYGADFSLNGGDTVYTFNAATGEMSIDGVGQGTPGGNRIFLTLWDGNGNDTYDLSNYTSDLDLDLNAGSQSDFNSGQSAYLGFGGPNGGYARGNVYNALQYNGDLRSLIENAIGGSGNDEILGNQVANVLTGNDGDDTLVGNDGNDTLKGGAGADDMDGGDGRDAVDYSDETADLDINLAQSTVTGGNATGDTITSIEDVISGAGNDSILGSTENNDIDGGDGNDVIKSGLGNDTLFGRQGDDTISGGADDDEIVGGGGRDLIKGGDGADTLTGGAGDDIVFSTSADAEDASDADVDSLVGGLGDDTLVLGNGDLAQGGDGADTYVLRADVNDTVTVSDIDETLDMLVVESSEPDDVTIVGQTTTADGLSISLNTGGVILLAGLSAEIDPSLLRVEAPGTSSTA